MHFSSECSWMERYPEKQNRLGKNNEKKFPLVSLENNLKEAFYMQMQAELKVLQIITNKHTQKRIQYILSADLKETKMPLVEF